MAQPAPHGLPPPPHTPPLPPNSWVERRLEYTVPPDQDGILLYRALRRHMGLSVTWIRRIKWLEDGILVDGRRSQTRSLLNAGQRVSARLSDPQRYSRILPAPGVLDIVYQDRDILVLNKTPGVSVHPGPGHYDDTLGNFLLYYYDQEGIEADFHPVHRLDRDTSGLMVVALHPHAQEILKGQLHTNTFHRCYLALCHGAPAPPAGVVDCPIGRVDESLALRQVRCDGLPASTRYETLSTHGGLSLVRLTLDTGRTHQIRVHMAHLGCPLAGDVLYGAKEPGLIRRTALHSHTLELCHPISGKRLSFTCPIPEDMARLTAL